MVAVSLFISIIRNSSFDWANPFQPSVAFDIEIFFCTAKQMTDFYIKCDTGFKGVNESEPMIKQYSAGKCLSW